LRVVGNILATISFSDLTRAQAEYHDFPGFDFQISQPAGAEGNLADQLPTTDGLAHDNHGLEKVGRPSSAIILRVPKISFTLDVGETVFLHLRVSVMTYINEGKVFRTVGRSLVSVGMRLLGVIAVCLNPDHTCG